MTIKTVYLIGPVEFANRSRGSKWQRVLAEQLGTIGVICFDPEHDSYRVGSTLQDNADYAARVKGEGLWSELVVFMNLIWGRDRELVGGSDALIMYAGTPEELRELVFSIGTIRELSLAFEQKKPAFLIYAGNVAQASSHFLHLVLARGAIVPDTDTLVKHLLAYNNGRNSD